MNTALNWLAQLPPTPTIDAGRCTRRFDSGCRVCVASCPVDALELDADSVRLPGAVPAPGAHAAPVVRADRCVGCGVCQVACPADAISGVGPSVPGLLQRATGKSRLVLRCVLARQWDSGAESGLADVGCLAAVDPELLVAAAAGLDDEADAGAEVELRRGPCDACPLASFEAVAATVRTAQRLLAQVAPAMRLVDNELLPGEVPPRRPAPARPAGVKLSRRGFFGRSEPEPATEPDSPAAPLADPPRSVRAALLDAAPGAPLPVLQVAPGCTGCQACVRVCPTEALGWVGELGAGVLTFDARACVACGECVRVCPEEVVELPGVRAPATGIVTLAQVASAVCSRCAMPLAPGEQGLCTRCRARADFAAEFFGG